MPTKSEISKKFNWTLAMKHQGGTLTARGNGNRYKRSEHYDHSSRKKGDCLACNNGSRIRGYRYRCGKHRDGLNGVNTFQ